MPAAEGPEDSTEFLRKGADLFAKHSFAGLCKLISGTWIDTLNNEIHVSDEKNVAKFYRQSADRSTAKELKLVVTRAPNWLASEHTTTNGGGKEVFDSLLVP